MELVRMRVHHIISNYSNHTGGAQQVVRNLHLELRAQQIESYILGLMQQDDDNLKGAVSLNLKTPYHPRAFFGIADYLSNNVKSDDIVHVHLFPTIFYLSLLNLMSVFQVHLICTEHSTSNRRRGTILGRILDMITYAAYDRVITISKGVEKELIKWKPGLRGKTCVIYNGIPLTFKERILRRSKKRLQVLSVGNLRTPKNYDNALRAIALLDDLDFGYAIAGKGECEKSLKRLSKELDLESKVRFLGYVDDVPDLLASADIFLMPSRWEGFGIAAVEAMNASLPLVASNVPGLQEILKSDPPCALLVDPESPRSIAEGLRQTLVSPELRFQLGGNAFTQAKKFSMDKLVDKHIDFYEKLI